MEGKKRNGHEPCPFVESPMKNCYCADATSKNIGKIVFYCGHQFKKCSIYGDRQAMEKG